MKPRSFFEIYEVFLTCFLEFELFILFVVKTLLQMLHCDTRYELQTKLHLKMCVLNLS